MAESDMPGHKKDGILTYERALEIATRLTKYDYELWDSPESIMAEGLHNIRRALSGNTLGLVPLSHKQWVMLLHCIAVMRSHVRQSRAIKASL